MRFSFLNWSLKPELLFQHNIWTVLSDLNTPSILPPETFYTNKTIYENPASPHQSSTPSSFVSQTIKSSAENALNFSLDQSPAALSFLEKVEKLKAKKKLNASTTPVSYQSWGSKHKITKSPDYRIKFYSSTGMLF